MPLYFYPRPPRGGRRQRRYQRAEHREFLSTPSARRATTKNILHRIIYPLFLSTPSARRATGRLCLTVPIPTISIHALREEGDPSSSPLAIASANFYPRPPRGGRHRHCTRGHRPRNFYPRPPRGGRRDRLLYPHQRRAISIHALREEGDQLPPPPPGRTKYFYPRPPRGGRPGCSGLLS